VNCTVAWVSVPGLGMFCGLTLVAVVAALLPMPTNPGPVMSNVASALNPSVPEEF